MQDVIDNALGWLDEQNAAFRSRAVTYTRSGTTASVAAVLDGSDFGANPEDVSVIAWNGIDFLIRPADLAAFTTPLVGDRITATVNGESKEYEVLSPDGFPHYVRIDNNRRFRIHAKLVG